MKPLTINKHFEDYDYEVNDSNSLIKDHRCKEMISHEYERNKNKLFTTKKYYIEFVVKYDQGKWNLYNNDIKGMVIVQCPFCHKKMFAGNEVTIE